MVTVGSRVYLGDKKTWGRIIRDLGAFNYIIEVDTKNLRGVKLVDIDEIRRGIFFSPDYRAQGEDDSSYKFKRGRKNRT